MSYIKIIEQAIIFFPLIAIIITAPFVLVQYHKYGSISFLKTLVIYSFVLYLLAAYFLVILPLPNQEVVANLTTPRMQLVPFMFIYDFIKEFSFSIHMLTKNCFYMPFFNMLLTIPFGIYLRYLFEIDFKKCLIYTFLLSLFFELTQLTGLYFIYPRGYRLFDVDDLFLNTLGGIIGYWIGGLLLKPLPTIDEVNNSALEKGRKVSGLKKSVSFLLDLFLYSIIASFFSFLVSNKNVPEIILIIYYVIIPIINKGSTLGQKFLNLKIVSINNKYFAFKLIVRITSFIICYAAIPIGLLRLIVFIGNSDLTYLTKAILASILGGSLLLIYLITFIEYLFTHKDILYEKISKTKLVSTL